MTKNPTRNKGFLSKSMRTSKECNFTVASTLLTCGFIVLCVVQTSFGFERGHSNEFRPKVFSVQVRKEGTTQWEHYRSDHLEKLRTNFITLLESGNFSKVIDDLSKTSLRNKRQIEDSTNSNEQGNQNPYFIGPSSIRVEIGEITKVQMTAVDPDEDPITFSLEGNILSNAEIQADGLFTIVPNNPNVSTFLAMLVTVNFVVTDTRGGRTTFQPNWEVCGCRANSMCAYDKPKQELGKISLVQCACTLAYTGAFCNQDKNDCLGHPCFPGVICTDKKAPEFGYTCGRCPHPLTGDGITCSSQCVHPGQIENGITYGEQITVSGQLRFECNDGYRLVGEPILTCQRTNAFDYSVPTCRDVDECVTSSCPGNSSCVNSVGSFHCICEDGFVGTGTRCVPLIEFIDFGCNVEGNSSISLNWEVVEKWYNSSIITQFVVTWYSLVEDQNNIVEELHTYDYQFSTYIDKLEDVINKTTIPSLRYVSVRRDITSYLITGLKPATSYRVAIRIVHSEGQLYNGVESCESTTLDGVSSKPIDFQVVHSKASSTSIKLYWYRPLEPKGNVRAYIVQYSETEASCANKRNPPNCGRTEYYRVPGWEFGPIIYGLEPSTEYNFQVAALNRAGVGHFTAKMLAQTKDSTAEGARPSIMKPVGQCFEGQFLVDIRPPTSGINIFVVSSELRRALLSAFGRELGYVNAIDIRNVTLTRFGEGTQAKLQLYVDADRPIASAEWIDTLQRAYERGMSREVYLQIIRAGSMRFSECNECEIADLSGLCPFNSNCLDIPEGYTCYCLPGYISVPQSDGSKLRCQKRTAAVDERANPLGPDEMNPACRLSSGDVYILIQSGDEMGKDNFDKVKNALLDLIAMLPIAPNDTQVGFAAFSSRVVLSSLKQYQTQENLAAAIRNTSFIGGKSDLFQAMEDLNRFLLSSHSGRRDNRNLYVMLITSAETFVNVTSIAILRQHSLETHVIRVSGNTSEENIQEMMNYSNGSISLIHSSEEISDTFLQICSGAKPAEKCDKKQSAVDVVYVLDSSSVTVKALFESFLDVIKMHVNDVDVGSSATRIAVVTYSNFAQVEIPFGLNHNKTALSEALNEINYQPHNDTRNIGAALQLIIDNVLSNKVKKTTHVILFVTGISSDDFEIQVHKLVSEDVIISSLSFGLTNSGANYDSIYNGLRYNQNTLELSSDLAANLSSELQQEIENSLPCAESLYKVEASSVTTTSAIIQWNFTLFSAASYRMQYYTKPGADVIDQVVSTSSVSLTSLQPGTRYFARIQPISDSLQDFTDPIQFWTNPAQIASFNISFGANQIRFTFDRVAGGSSAYIAILFNSATSQELGRKIVFTKREQDTYTVAFNSTKTGRYYVVVLTQSGPKTSKPSRFDVVLVAPDTPTGLGIRTIETNSFTVEWDPVPAARGYVVTVIGKFLGISDRRPFNYATQETTFTQNDVMPGHNYLVSIASYGNSTDVRSDPTAPITVITRPIAAVDVNVTLTLDDIPEAVIELTARPEEEAEVLLLTLYPMNNPEDVIYQDELDPVSLSAIRLSEGLVPGTSYVIEVTTAVGSSTSAPITHVFQYNVLLRPQNVVFTNLTATTATLSWDIIDDAASYLVRMQHQKANMTNQTDFTTDTNSFQVSGLIPGTEYVATVQGVRGNWLATISQPAYGRTLDLFWPFEVRIAPINDTSAQVTFTSGSASVDTYVVNVFFAEKLENALLTGTVEAIEVDALEYKLMIGQLQSGSDYVVTVTAKIGTNIIAMARQNFTTGGSSLAADIRSMEMAATNIMTIDSLAASTTALPENRITCHRTQRRLDLAFILTSTFSVRPVQFEIQLEFVLNVSRRLVLGDNDTQIDVYSYASNVEKQLLYEDYNGDREIFEKKLRTIIPTYTPDTNMGKAIAQYQRQVIRRNQRSGTNDHADHFLIIFAHGASSDAPKSRANSFKASGGFIIPVGIGPNIVRKQLEEMASSPDLAFYQFFFTDLVEDLDEITVAVRCTDNDQMTSSSSTATEPSYWKESTRQPALSSSAISLANLEKAEALDETTQSNDVAPYTSMWFANRSFPILASSADKPVLQITTPNSATTLDSKNSVNHALLTPLLKEEQRRIFENSDSTTLPTTSSTTRSNQEKRFQDKNAIPLPSITSTSPSDYAESVFKSATMIGDQRTANPRLDVGLVSFADSVGGGSFERKNLLGPEEPIIPSNQVSPVTSDDEFLLGQNDPDEQNAVTFDDRQDMPSMDFPRLAFVTTLPYSLSSDASSKEFFVEILETGSDHMSLYLTFKKLLPADRYEVSVAPLLDLSNIVEVKSIPKVKKQTVYNVTFHRLIRPLTTYKITITPIFQDKALLPISETITTKRSMVDPTEVDYTTTGSNNASVSSSTTTPNLTFFVPPPLVLPPPPLPLSIVTAKPVEKGTTFVPPLPSSLSFSTAEVEKSISTSELTNGAASLSSSTDSLPISSVFFTENSAEISTSLVNDKNSVTGKSVSSVFPPTDLPTALTDRIGENFFVSSQEISTTQIGDVQTTKDIYEMSTAYRSSSQSTVPTTNQTEPAIDASSRSSDFATDYITQTTSNSMDATKDEIPEKITMTESSIFSSASLTPTTSSTSNKDNKSPTSYITTLHPALSFTEETTQNISFKTTPFQDISTQETKKVVAFTSDLIKNKNEINATDFLSVFLLSSPSTKTEDIMKSTSQPISTQKETSENGNMAVTSNTFPPTTPSLTSTVKETEESSFSIVPSHSLLLTTDETNQHSSPKPVSHQDVSTKETDKATALPYDFTTGESAEIKTSSTTPKTPQVSTLGRVEEKIQNFSHSLSHMTEDNVQTVSYSINQTEEADLIDRSQRHTSVPSHLTTSPHMATDDIEEKTISFSTSNPLMPFTKQGTQSYFYDTTYETDEVSTLDLATVHGITTSVPPSNGKYTKPSSFSALLQ